MSDTSTLSPYRIVNHNQDTLLVNFKFANEDGTLNGATLPDHVAAELDEWQALARKEHTPQPTSLTFSYLLGSDLTQQTLFIRPHGASIWSWLLYCDDLTLSMAYGSINGTYARVRCSSHLLHTIGAENALLRIEAMLSAFIQEQHTHKQVSEIHLCADIVGWDLSSVDWQRDFISRVVLIRERPELPEEEEQAGGLSPREGEKLEKKIKKQMQEVQHMAFPTTEHRKIATLDFGTHGSQISAQIYNKSREIKKHKKAWFLPIWQANGYNPETDGDVIRLEFRIKRAWLAHYDLNDPADVFTRLEQLWRYCTEEWLRYVDSTADTANISRRPTREVWTVFQNAYTLASSHVTRSQEGEQQARLSDLIARDPLSALQAASNLQLEQTLLDEPTALPAPALRPVYLTCQSVLHPLFACYFLHWLSMEPARRIHDRLMLNREAIASSLSDLPTETIADLARQELSTLSPDRLAFYLSLHSPSSFRTVQTSLVKRSRRMAKREACIAALAGYLRSAIALAGEEVAEEPDLLASLIWLHGEIQSYDDKKGRSHLYEVRKKQLSYNFITAEQLFEEMAHYGVELRPSDREKIETHLADLRRSSAKKNKNRLSPATDSDLMSA